MRNIEQASPASMHHVECRRDMTENGPALSRWHPD